MYLYGATLSSDLPRNNQNYLYRTVGKELNSKYITKETSRDTTSSKLNIKGPKIADAIHKTEVGFLRKQIQAFPEGLKENARTNYLLQQNNKRKDLQEFQCIMLAKFETILRQKLIEQGLNYRRFKIGGTDRGTYEKFFKVSPARYMSKSQLSTALRQTFGDSMIKSAAEVNLLFDSFDYNRTDEMDWRSFLFLVLIMMQPRYNLLEHLKWGYAIYSSIGSLDLDCTEKLSLGMLKDMICTPILLSQRSQVRNEFDKAWMHLSSTDSECMQVAVKGKSSTSNDPDDVKISYKIFKRIITETLFADFLAISQPYGKRDSRQWTAALEEDFYHFIILKKLKELRREDRNELEADKFLALKDRRRKIVAFKYILEVKKKRDLLRLILIGCEIRTLIQTCGKYFDRWKRLIIQLYGLQIVQRMVRGFIARRRKKFIKKLKSETVKLQSTTRQLLTKLKYRKKHYKYYWAAVTIQRVYRGRINRLKIITSLEARYDEGKRLLAKEKEEWLLSRKIKACIAIQTMIRKFLRRRRTMKRLDHLERVEQTKFNMELVQKKGNLAKNVYQQQLSKWYIDRKEEHDRDLLTEDATNQQKKAIINRRNKLAAEERERLKAIQQAKIERIEEEQIEMWLKNWEFKIEQRAKTRRTKCNNCLILPETPEDVILKKYLLKKTQLAIKEVLRRADKQKIPMEIPEAREIAQKEVVDKEVENEIERARQEMREEATRIQKEKELKEELKNQAEIMAKKRRRKWAVVSLQSYMRVFLARKRLRERAYKRFQKHFDVDRHEYFYEDTRSGETFWTKPKSVGSYDIPMENYWVVMHKQHGHKYYYNPCKWTQVWDLPEGCTLCEQCSDYFAVALLSSDNVCYCEHCLYKIAQNMIDDGYDAMNIMFKEFDGNKTTSVLTDFRYIEETSWFKYVMNVSSYNKLSKEEEEFEKKKLLRRQDSIKNKIKKNCNICESDIASLSCIQCEKQYCQLCFSVEHESEEMLNHQATKIEDITLPPIESRKSKKDKSKKKKSKKSSRSKSPSDVFSSGDETTNTEGEKKKKKKKSKKSKKSKKDGAISDSQDEKSEKKIEITN